MSLYKRGEVWWAYVSVGGQRVRRSTGTQDREKAKAFHDQLKVDLRKRKDEGHTLADAIKLWLKVKERSDREKSAIRVFLKSFPSRPLSKITGHDIHDALLSYKASTAERTLSNIRAALKLASDRKWCEPIKIPKRKVKSTDFRWLTIEEWKRLEAELPEHLRYMASFAVYTGIRQSNVFNLQWKDVDLPSATAWIKPSEAKGRKTIPIPLSKRAVELLEALKGKSEVYVFTYRGNPIKSPKTAFSKALVRAKIYLRKEGDEYVSDFRWHDLRHTWASWHVQNGTPLKVLQEMGGWASIEMVMKYAHLAPDHLRQFADNAVA
jgi:integrase